jgi:hypothetical protein
MLVEELVFLCEGLKFAVNGCDVLQVGISVGPYLIHAAQALVIG